MGVADAQVSRWETGRVVPQRRNLEAIANALCVRAGNVSARRRRRRRRGRASGANESLSRATGRDSEDFRQRVSGRIRASRDEHGLTRVALARLLPGTTDSGQVSRWERGESSPNLANVQARASVFGVSEEEVLGGRCPERTPRRRRHGLSD